nr:MAG TPA: hypothetical protein [Caudoviricetes sp.]
MAKPNNSHSTIGKKPPTIAESSATIERLSDRRQHKLPLRQLLAEDADKNRKKKTAWSLKYRIWRFLRLRCAALMAILC